MRWTSAIKYTRKKSIARDIGSDNMDLFLIVLVVFVSALLLINQLYKNTNHNKNFFENAKKFMDGVPGNLEIVATGSSYAKFGIDFSNTNYRGFNFGVVPQSLNYDYKILQQYRKCLKKNCVVLITLAPLVFAFVDYEDDTKNYKYYKFLNKKYINNYKLKTKITHVQFPILATPRLCKYIWNDVEPNDMYHSSCPNELVNRQEADAREAGWCHQFQLNNLQEAIVPENIKDSFETTIDILNNMIEFCINNKISPVLVIPPVSGILSSKISKKFLDEYLYENINKANKAGIPVLDFWNSAEYSCYFYYINSDFMNRQGREKFTGDLLGKLRDLSLIS